jgi:hypothetical protein
MRVGLGRQVPIISRFVIHLAAREDSGDMLFD